MFCRRGVCDSEKISERQKEIDRGPWQLVFIEPQDEKLLTKGPGMAALLQ